MSLTKASYSMVSGAPYNVVDYGGASSNTTAQNKTALQAAITAANTAGGGVVVVPYPINYGYIRSNSTTWPNLSAVVTDILVIDYSKGNTYVAPSVDGMQVRYWSSSSPYDTLGQHDGNGQWIRGGHSPYLAVSTDSIGGTAATMTATVTGGVITAFTVVTGGSGYTYPPSIVINGNPGTGLQAFTTISGGAITGAVIVTGGTGYTPTNGTIGTVASPGAAGVEVVKSNLASLFFMQSSNALWSLNNGGVRSGAYTDNELNDFALSAFGSYAGGTTTGTNILVVKRSNGAFGFNVSNPTNNFEFGSYSGGACTVNISAGTSSTTAVPSLLWQDLAYPATYGGIELRGTNAVPYLQIIAGASNIAKIYKSSGGSAGVPNAAAAIFKVDGDGVTSRSINAGGTVNASGADYAEYMEKAGDFTIAKGDVCGIDANGKLTNVFADAVSFVVKSTNPSYVGNDVWGVKSKQDAGDQYTDVELESKRQAVDRIAFAGQVPVNVLGATPGQYIIPVNENGAIKGQVVSSPSFEQYQSAVGKVIAIETDGRARIVVKIA